MFEPNLLISDSGFCFFLLTNKFNPKSTSLSLERPSNDGIGSLLLLEIVKFGLLLLLLLNECTGLNELLELKDTFLKLLGDVTVVDGFISTLFKSRSSKSIS